jgi:histone acetyltransferase
MNTDDNAERGEGDDSSKKRKLEEDPSDAVATADEINADEIKDAESSENTAKKARTEEEEEVEEPPKKDDDDEHTDKMDVEEPVKPTTEEGESSEKVNEEDKTETSAETAGEATKENSEPDPEKKHSESSGDAEFEAEATPQVEIPKERTSVSDKPAEDPGKNPYDSIRWTIIKNDGKSESLIKLVALKSLFAKQLPKMPRAYIARLVFDRRHISLVILSDDPKVKDTDKEVIGSICYRPFPEMRFAEIAFCAVNADHQVKVRRSRT